MEEVDGLLLQQPITIIILFLLDHQGQPRHQYQLFSSLFGDNYYIGDNYFHLYLVTTCFVFFRTIGNDGNAVKSQIEFH